MRSSPPSGVAVWATYIVLATRACNEPVAIKVLSADLAGDPALRGRFEREARTIAALDHPHICAVYDVGEQDGVHYLVMPHLEGETLADRLARAPGGLHSQRF